MKEAHSEETVTSKPLDWFKTAPQVRRHFDEAELGRLGESLKVRQLQPVLARSDGTLIAGERRLRAARIAGLKTLEVKIIDGLTDSEIRIIQLTENVHRAGLSASEKWRACADLMLMNPHWTKKDLADHLKLDASMVTRLLSPSKCPGEVQEALDAGKIGIADCYTIAKEKDEQKQLMLLELKLNGASRDEIERARRQPKPKRKSPRPQLSEMRCPLPGGGRVSLRAETLTMSAILEMLTELAEAVKKAIQEQQDLKTFAALMQAKAKAGG